MPFASAIFHEHSHINNLYYYEDDCQYDAYNLVILLRRFPSIVHMTNVKIFNANLNAAIKTFRLFPEVQASLIGAGAAIVQFAVPQGYLLYVRIQVLPDHIPQKQRV